MTARRTDAFETAAARLRAAGTPHAVATVVRTLAATSAKPGAKALVLADGTIAAGWIGGGCARGAVARAAQEALADGRSQLVSLRPEEFLDAEGVAAGEEREGIRFARNGCPSKGSMDIFVEPVLPRPRLVILGAGPVAMALADLAAHFDFHRTLAAPGIVPGAAEVEATQDGFVIEPGGGAIRFLVVATQGSGDEAALLAALASGAGYVAFVGSHAKFAALRARLEAKGIDPEAVAAVRSPAGLDLGAIAPEEIALSILAQIVAERRRAGRKAAEGRA